jgi:F0F1-type ATP synthase delta subunit
MEENFKKKILKKLSAPISDYLKKKKTLNSEVDPGEYDSEGSMAKSQLTSILNNAKEIKEMLSDNDNLPEWVQSKITKAEDYISTCKNYLQSEKTEKSESTSFKEYAKEI